MPRAEKFLRVQSRHESCCKTVLVSEICVFFLGVYFLMLLKLRMPNDQVLQRIWVARILSSWHFSADKNWSNEVKQRSLLIGKELQEQQEVVEDGSIMKHSGQIIATSLDLIPKGSWRREILWTLFSGSDSTWWNDVTIWPDETWTDPAVSKPLPKVR